MCSHQMTPKSKFAANAGLKSVHRRGLCVHGSPAARGKIELQPTMLPDIENLLLLQDADKQIRRLNDEIAQLPKRVAVIEQKLAGTHAILEKAKAAVKADEAARRKYDTAIVDLQGKISKYRDQSLA